MAGYKYPLVNHTGPTTIRFRVAMALARFAAKATSPERKFGNRSTVIATNLLRKDARKAK